MNRDLIWKIGLILFLAALAVWNVYPPKEKLKQGLDLAGGTSLIYEIDTSDLTADERRGLAQRMIPILLNRIDPTHVANIVMRPQGDTRIEIQLPVASADTRKKREALEKELQSLEQENINLLRIKRALSMEQGQREALFEQYIKDSEQRKEILGNLAQTYDLLKAKQELRDSLYTQMEQIKNDCKALGLNADTIASQAATWVKESPDKRAAAIEDYIKSNRKPELQSDADALKELSGKVGEYLAAFEKWAPVVNEITEPDTGLNARWSKASEDLSRINLNTDLLRDVLEMPERSAQRKERLEGFKKDFPQREAKINAVVAVFDVYRTVSGRLDDPEDLKRMLKGAGVLEFRILPTGQGDNVNQEELAAYREALIQKGPKQASDSRYVWCEIEDPAGWGGGITGKFGDKEYVLASNLDNECMLRSGKNWKLKKAFPTYDSRTNNRAIGFVFDEVAANMFLTLTSSNLKRPLCILLDDVAISAPNIQSAIRSEGIITGKFSKTEVDDMVNKLNAGSFPARLSELPISEKSIGATIGADNRDQGIRAGVIGVIAVMVFMLFYYLACGALADFALLLNVLFVLAIMSAFRATFTLPGIGGLILTVGMSVDANVLIFERIREEQKRGSSLRSAIANGYSRAFPTIFDSNVTTFLVATILYLVASEEIKGFAIVLMLGIVSSMFTALFVTRVCFDFLTRKRLMTEPLKMMSIFRKLNINWMGLRPVFMLLSASMMIVGLAVFFTRNEKVSSKYDIEFTGGTSVQIDLKEDAALDRAKVEQIFSDYAKNVLKNNALAAAKVNRVGKTGVQYEISTTQTNKTTAQIRFNAPGAATVQSVTEKINESEHKNDFDLANLSVAAGENQTFEVSTSRVNASMIQQVLESAFAQEATVSEPQVNEVVSEAVRNAFGPYLSIREDLKPEIVSAEKVQENSPELADYLGGMKILCRLSHEVSGAELKSRIDDIRFKPDMRHLKWYHYNLLRKDLSELENQDEMNEFVFVSVHPEAGYRDLTDLEWNSYIENEKSKIVGAFSIESSLARITQIDPSIGSQAKTRALLAIILSLICVVAYVWVRFGTARYGFAAIVALIHDVCITVGLITACIYIAPTALGKALLIGDFKINMEMIAAFLTIIGYSLNDTIVVFDRIRENRGKLFVPTTQIINESINQTLSRTVLTSFTTFLAVLVMYIWGGPGLRGFTFAMLAGIIVGTYSSIAIAAPILLIGRRKES